MSDVVAVVGGGAFGRALAQTAAAKGRSVRLWSRRDQALNGPELSGVTIVRDVCELADAALLLVAVPSVHVASVCEELGRVVDGSHALVHVSRGLVGDELSTVTSVFRRVTACRRLGVIGGPLSAAALLKREPCGGIVASAFPEVATAVRDALAGPRVRLYHTSDARGVELASAFVGMLLLAMGFAKQTGLGPATLGIMATRGMAEATRLGVSLGATAETFHGLAGFGDLLAGLAGDDRPELRFGRALARGVAVSDATTEAGAYVEAAGLARRLAKLATVRGIEVPLVAAMAEVLEGRIPASDAVDRLMARRQGEE